MTLKRIIISGNNKNSLFYVQVKKIEAKYKIWVFWKQFKWLNILEEKLLEI